MSVINLNPFTTLATEAAWAAVLGEAALQAP
jgi:hypothetical protein